MKVHRTSIYKGNKVVRMDKYKFYKRKDDEDVFEEIKPFIESRSSYGYKRITALVNKERATKGQGPYNYKRIYRIMKMKGLILPRFTSGNRVKKEKSGKVMTLKSNTRWCSDCFEIKCFNREKVYVSFAMDTCDREIISFVAKKTPILGEDIEGLMIASVENRFKALKTPHRIQWLTDRGMIYRATGTQLMANKLGLINCYTRAYSPESNGMAEAFVKRFKEDYVYTNDVENATKTIELIKEWIEDYNENAPHSALGMKSPREFMRKTQV